jgi:hypothetical protein
MTNDTLTTRRLGALDPLTEAARTLLALLDEMDRHIMSNDIKRWRQLDEAAKNYRKLLAREVTRSDERRPPLSPEIAQFWIGTAEGTRRPAVQSLEQKVTSWLQDQVSALEQSGDGEDAKSWFNEEGILLSLREARFVLDRLRGQG